MRLAILLLLTLPLAGEPLRVVSVLRAGLPPYEDAKRIYRLEGEACGRLKSGEALLLRRMGEPRSLGCLKVTEVRGSYALAHLQTPGETYPLKGDLVLREEDINPLPVVALPTLNPLPSVAVPQAPVRTVPAPVPTTLPIVPAVPPSTTTPSEASKPETSTPEPPKPEASKVTKPQGVQRGAIYFLRADASLSPGALAKLKAWTEEWGSDGQWILGVPGARVPALDQERLQALKSELLRLGVSALDVRPQPEDVESKYDAIYVIRESR